MKTIIVLIFGCFIPLINSAVPRFDSLLVSKLCPRNKFVLKYENGTKRCTKCSRCHKGFKIKRECSTFENAICEPCPSGSYNDVINGDCKLCSVCNPGEYVRRACSAKRDTKCRKCPRDYFTQSGNVTSCLPCKTCRKNENIIKKCNGINDTECGQCANNYFRVSSSGSCLRCSKCPSSLQDAVVPECRKKLGIESSHICWPQATHGDVKSDVVTDVEETILEEPLEDYILISEILPIVLSLVVCVLILLFLIFAIIRCTKCETFFTRLIDKLSKPFAKPLENKGGKDKIDKEERDNKCDKDVDSGVDTNSLEVDFCRVKARLSDSYFVNGATTFEDNTIQFTPIQTDFHI